MTSKINIDNQSFIGTIRSLFFPPKTTNTVSLSENLPNEIQENILRFLSPVETAAATRVQRSWRDYLSSDTNKQFLPKETHISISGYYDYDNAKIYQETRYAMHKGEKVVSFEMPYQMQITNSGLKYLTDVPLKKLDLSRSHNITNDGLKHLTRVPLTALYLSDCSITDPGLRHIGRISSLRTLDLSRCDLKCYAPISAIFTTSEFITDKGIKLIRHMSLNDLRLSGCMINDEALKHVAVITTLTKLDLSFTSITNKGVRHLAKLTSLKHLNLKCCKNITNIGLRSLAFLPCLTGLNLVWSSNNITTTGIETLQGLRRAFYFFGAQQHITECNLFDKSADSQEGNWDNLYHMIATYCIPDSLQVEK